MISLDRLLTWLNQSGIQTNNNSLYQVIKTLIQAAQEFQNETNDAINPPSGGGGLVNQHYLTHQNDLATLPQSRQLLAGTGITFDDTVFGERTIDAGGTAGYWTLLTDGDVDETDFIFAGGDAISIFVPL